MFRNVCLHIGLYLLDIRFDESLQLGSVSRLLLVPVLVLVEGTNVVGCRLRIGMNEDVFVYHSLLIFVKSCVI